MGQFNVSFLRIESLPIGGRNSDREQINYCRQVHVTILNLRAGGRWTCLGIVSFSLELLLRTAVGGNTVGICSNLTGRKVIHRGEIIF